MTKLGLSCLVWCGVVGIIIVTCGSCLCCEGMGNFCPPVNLLLCLVEHYTFHSTKGIKTTDRTDPRRCFTEMTAFDPFPQRVHCCAGPCRFRCSTGSLVYLAVLLHMTHTLKPALVSWAILVVRRSPEIIASESASDTERITDQVSEINKASLLVIFPSFLLYSAAPHRSTFRAGA